MSPVSFTRITLALTPMLAVLSTGCSAVQKLPFVAKLTKSNNASASTPIAKATPTPAAPAPPQIDYAKVRPNELGNIPVVMYHDIGTKPPKHDYGLVRSVADFEKDLELLYAAGFRPVNMGDVIQGKIDVPAGMSPVVITFDDARESQFRLIETDKSLKVDPKCGIGILQAFHKAHPDWGLKGTFFCLPKSPRTIDSFGQSGLGDQKLAYLVEHGFEIGNHTVNHLNMSKMSPAQIQAEVGGAHNSLMASVPTAKITVVALPMGVYPRKKADWKYLVSGTFEGKSYSYTGAMLAAFRPIPSPLSKKFNPLRMERIAPMDKDPNGLRNWIKKLTAASGDRFISDGDVNTISYSKSMEKEVNLAKIKEKGLLANAYSPFGDSGGSKPIVTDGDTTDTKPVVANAPSTAPATAKPISAE